MLEVEALRPDPGAVRAHLDLLSHSQLGAEVDLDPGEDEVDQVAEHADPGLFEVRREDSVVDVPHRIAVTKADEVAVDVRKGGHAAF